MTYSDERATIFTTAKDSMLQNSPPKLPMESEVAPLMKLKIKLSRPPVEISAVLRAVSGRAFCISFSEDVRRLRDASGFELADATHAWRSNFPAGRAQQPMHVTCETQARDGARYASEGMNP